MTQPTAAERLPGALASRLADFDVMTKRDDPDEGDDDLGPLSEYPLSATIRYSVRVELSTGGPADYLDATVDPDGTITRIVYHFADWWDHAERTLEGDEFDTAKRFIEALYGGDLSEIGEYVKSDR